MNSNEHANRQVDEGNDTTSIEDRISALEKQIKEVPERMLERQLRTVTTILGVTGGLIVATGLLSAGITRLIAKDTRDDSREYLGRMEKQVSMRIEDMERRFERLAGDAFKRPLVSLVLREQPLEGQSVEMPLWRNVQPLEALFPQFSFKNIGSKRSEPVSIHITVNTNITLAFDDGSWRLRQERADENILSFSQSGSSYTVAPGETLSMPQLRIRLHRDIYSISNFPVSVTVFYGADQPATARFQVRITEGGPESRQ